MAGELDQAIKNALISGINDVLHTEVPELKMTRAAKVSQLAREASILMAKQGKLNTQRIVQNAAMSASKRFQQNDMFEKIQDAFTKLESALSQADHSSAEDDRIREAARELSEGAEENAAKVAKLYEQYYRKYDSLYKVEQGILNNQENIEIEKLMKESYTILTEIGEILRGTSIVYEVQMNIGQAGKAQTGFFTLSQMMNYARVTSKNGNAVLKIDYKAIQNDYAQGKISLFNWNDEMVNRYNNLKQAVIANESTNSALWKSNIGRDKKYINQGNIMEAFRAASTSIVSNYFNKKFNLSPEQILALDDHGIHYTLHKGGSLLHNMMSDVLSNTKSFLQGGDFSAEVEKLFENFNIAEGFNLDEYKQNIFGGASQIDIQEKLQNARFSTLSSLWGQLVQADATLKQLQNLDQNTIESQLQNISGYDEIADEAILDLVSQFIGI